MDHKHWNHPTKWDVDLGLVFEKHFMFSQNICSDDLVPLDNLDYRIKRQGVQSL